MGPHLGQHEVQPIHFHSCDKLSTWKHDRGPKWWIETKTSSSWEKNGPRMMILGEKTLGMFRVSSQSGQSNLHLINPLPLSPLLAMVLCKIIRPAAFSVSKFLLNQLRASLNKPSQRWSKQYHLPSTTRPFLPLKFHAELLDFNRRPLSRLRDRRSGDCSGAQGPLH